MKSRQYGYIGGASELAWVDTETTQRSSVTNLSLVFKFNSNITKLNESTLMSYGGSSGATSTNEVWRIDVSKEFSCVAKAKMTHSRNTSTACAYQGRLIVMGGFSQTSNLAECESYDPTNDTWTEIPAMPIPLGASNSVLIPSLQRIYVIGGLSPEINNAILELDLTTFTWVVINIDLRPTLFWTPCFMQATTDSHFYFIADDRVCKYEPLENRLKIVKKLRLRLMGWAIHYAFIAGIIYPFPGIHHTTDLVIGGLV